MPGLTGVTANTAARRLLGEGVAYANYGEVGERLLGAVTQGQWDPGIELAEGAVAGTLGVLKGMDYIVSCKPTLQMTLLEITEENLIASLPGGASAGAGSHTLVPSEWLGLGDAAETVFPLEQDYVWDGSLRIWGDVGHGPVLLTEGVAADYTVVYATGVVTFLAAPPIAAEAYSRSGFAPTLDMTAFPAEVDAVIQLDGGPPTPVVFAWAGCTTGALTAAQIQAAIQALAGLFGAVTCTYVAGVPGVSDYYQITGSTTGAAMSVVITDGGANSCTDELLLGIADGGTEVLGGDAQELTAEYHYDASDGVATHETITANDIAEATDYLTNVAWLGRCVDQPAEELIIIVKNAIPTVMAPWTLEEKGAIGLQTTWRGSVDGATPQELPFEIRRPVPA